ncbi:HNH endonuclease [Lederbergia galactosidilytica]|uniref:Putative HNH nuclease YajD n=1 Tax=Lederbergia galactosidilytica TaxID=217031 RepID=A0A177ZXL9_9BACI|nr:HNH endonuclease signature motif containing protein [Lederbergia galactosidilytica]OAK72675.1 endonuclease [Lederbergia galactosidilytica]
MKYCGFNGCSNKIRTGYYCDEHKRKKPKRKKNKKSIYHSKNKSFYNSDPWKAMRSVVYDRERGYCQRCNKFVFGRRAHVHHVIPISEDETLKLDPNNLRLLCPQCHTIEENEDKKRTVFPSYFG